MAWDNERLGVSRRERWDGIIDYKGSRRRDHIDFSGRGLRQNFQLGPVSTAQTPS